MKKTPTKSPKTKKNKDSYIQEILAHIKTEINSNDEGDKEKSSISEKTITKNRNANNNADTSSFISLLVRQESDGLLKKKKRKSMQEISSDELIIKKVKIEPEDADISGREKGKRSPEKSLKSVSPGYVKSTKNNQMINIQKNLNKTIEESRIIQRIEENKKQTGSLSNDLKDESLTSKYHQKPGVDSVKNKSTIKHKKVPTPIIEKENELSSSKHSSADNIVEKSYTSTPKIIQKTKKKHKASIASSDESTDKSDQEPHLPTPIISKKVDPVNHKPLMNNNVLIPISKVTKKENKDDSDVSNSTEETDEVPKPKLKTKKNVTSKQRNTDNDASNSDKSDPAEESVEVPRPKLIKEENVAGGHSNDVDDASDESDSAEETVKVPRPKIKKEGKNMTVEQRNTDDETSATGESDSAEENVEVPKPKIKKEEKNMTGKQENIDNEISATDDSTEEKIKVPQPKLKNEGKNVTGRQENSDDETSDSHESDSAEVSVRVPKPKIKKYVKNMTGKQESSDNENSVTDESDLAGEKVKVPQPKIKKKGKNMTGRQRNSDDETSTTDESDLVEESVKVPKPKIKKEENNITKKQGSSDDEINATDEFDSRETPVKVPKPQIKKEEKYMTGKQGSSDNETSAIDESDTTEDSVKVPKPKIKKDRQNVTVKQGSGDDETIEDFPSPIKQKLNDTLQNKNCISNVKCVKGNQVIGKQKSLSEIGLSSKYKFSDATRDKNDEELHTSKSIITKKSSHKTSKKNNEKILEVTKSDIKKEENNVTERQRSSDEDVSTPIKQASRKLYEKNSPGSVKKMLKNSVKVPTPKIIKKEEKEKDDMDESNSTEETLKVPKPKSKKEVQNIDKQSSDEKASDSDDSDSAEENVQIHKPTPKPKKGEKRVSDRRRSSHLENTDEDLPRPIKQESERLNDSLNIRSETAFRFERSEAWQQRMQMGYPNLVEVEDAANVAESEGEYFLLRVPKNIDVSLLLKQKVDPVKERNIHLNNMQYTFEPKESDPIIANVKGSKLVNIKRVVTLQRSLDVQPLKKVKARDRQDMDLPNNVKARHPLFGVIYKEKLKLGKDIKKKVLEAEENKNKQLLKKKKNKKMDTSTSDHMMDIFNSEALFSTPQLVSVDSSQSRKRKKKSKSNDLVESLNFIKQEPNLSSETYSVDDQPKKKKKKKIKETI